MKILVIEDEVKTAKFLKKGLSEAGYVIDVAADGLEGLHLAQEVDFDLVILDGDRIALNEVYVHMLGA